MGTRNFTCVILNGEQRLCQYCQWDGYPTYTGAQILKFLHDADLERLKNAVENTKIHLTDVDQIESYTGSTKVEPDVFRMIWNAQCELNKDKGPEDDFINSYETALLLFRNGQLNAAQLDAFMASSRDVGYQILPYLYDRDSDARPMDLFAIKDEYEEIRDFALKKTFDGFPTCDSQGYYIIDLDKNVVKMTFDDHSCEFAFEELPQDIDRVMFVFEKYIEKLEETYREELSNAGPQIHNILLQKTAAAIAFDIEEDMRNTSSEFLFSSEENMNDLCDREFIYSLLCKEFGATRLQRKPNLQDVVKSAESRNVASHISVEKKQISHR